MPDLDEAASPRTTPLDKGRQLREEVREHPRTTAISLVLAVLGSVVGATLTSFLGAGRFATLGGAAIGSVVPVIFRPAPRGLRIVLIVALSLVGLVLTVTGVTISDLLRGREGTIVPIPAATAEPKADATAGPSTTASASSSVRPGNGPEPGGPKSKKRLPGITASAASCGAVPIGNDANCASGIVVRSTGDVPLEITSVEMSTEEFSVQQDACRSPLAPGESCEIPVYIRAAEIGSRETTVVIHQNLPSPDTGTRVTLRAEGMHPDACEDGYRWRLARDDDHVCISDADYAQFVSDNAVGFSADRKAEDGPTCEQGYVWREAYDGDLACVTPDVRDLMHRLNANPYANRRF